MKIFIRISFFLLLFTIFSCTYRNLEDIKPNPLSIISCSDTSGTISFSQTIVPLLNTHCGRSNNSCHGSSPASGYNYNNFSDIKSVALSGQLIGAITHDPNYSPMPKNGAKLDECSIKKFQKWVAAGAPQN